MRAGACNQCVVERRCCGACWCCPWPAGVCSCGATPRRSVWRSTEERRRAPLRGVAAVLALTTARPDLRDALPLRPLADCITDSVLMGA